MRGVGVTLGVVGGLCLFEIGKQLRRVRVAEDREPRDDIEPVLGLQGCRPARRIHAAVGSVSPAADVLGTPRYRSGFRLRVSASPSSTFRPFSVDAIFRNAR